MTRQPPVGWLGALLWVLVNAVGWVIVGAGSMAGFVPGVSEVARLLLATLQWLLLRRWVARVGWWIPATLVGWFIAPFVAELVVELVRWVVSIVADERLDLAEVVVGFGAAGATIGAAQWLVLRRTRSRAAWWVVASAAAWSVAELTGAQGAELADWLVPSTGPVPWYVGFWTTNALVHATVMAVALTWMTRD